LIGIVEKLPNYDWLMFEITGLNNTTNNTKTDTKPSMVEKIKRAI
jgi:hypothetical protein